MVPPADDQPSSDSVPASFPQRTGNPAQAEKADAIQIAKIPTSRPQNPNNLTKRSAAA